jgi:hypothetical protein
LEKIRLTSWSAGKRFKIILFESFKGPFQKLISAGDLKDPFEDAGSLNPEVEREEELPGE